MRRKVVLNKKLVLEHCQTHPKEIFSIDDIGRSLKSDGITGFTRAAITAQLGVLARMGVIGRVSGGIYRRVSKLVADKDITNETISMAQIGKSMYCYMKLLENENAELKKRLGNQETVNIRDITGGKL